MSRVTKIDEVDGPADESATLRLNVTIFTKNCTWSTDVRVSDPANDKFTCNSGLLSQAHESTIVFNKHLNLLRKESDINGTVERIT